MHVLLVNNLYPPIMAGGAELVVQYLAEGLAARGHRATVVSTCGREMEPYPNETRNGVEIIRFFPRNLYWSFTRTGESRVRRALWHALDTWNLDAAHRFRAILQATRPDMVHTHVIDGFSASIWRRARRAGVPVVHTAHDYHLICPRAFLLSRSWRICSHPTLTCQAYRAWHLHTTQDVDLFVSPSQFLLDKHREAGLTCARTAVVRNGIPLPPPRLHAASAGTGARFLLLCRLTPEKGVHTVLEAMRHLRDCAEAKLIIAGRGPLEAEVRRAAAEDPRISFAGFVQGSAKEELLATADYLLIPSLWYENAPVAVIEAAAYGLGLIGSRIGGIPELVVEGSTGLLFEPGDARGLARIIGDLSGGRVALHRFASAAQSIAAGHSVDRMVDAYLDHYRDLQECIGRRVGAGQEDAGSLLRSSQASL
ncbi:MAG: glycosyltransferase family 4 protein [Acetobacteraceae bacterium]|nr:glycosyltransferase family 4 protein [Acetobacteraceae bacterium]